MGLNNPLPTSQYLPQIKDNKLMLYMKGTPSAPACGFSMQVTLALPHLLQKLIVSLPSHSCCTFPLKVVRILHAQGVDFASVNVMDYPAIREGIKEYSEWPTVPQVSTHHDATSLSFCARTNWQNTAQVYLNGEFVGGCDILTQLHQSGELEEMLRKAGLAE